MRRTTGETNRRTVLRGIGTAALGGAVGIAGAVERAGATGSRASQEVDTSLPPGAVLFDLDGDGAYDAVVERAPESLADDDRPNPIRIASGGLATVDYAASVVEPEGHPALGDLDRLAYDYRAVTGDGAAVRALGVGGGFAQTAETTDDGGTGGDDRTTEESDGGETTEPPDDPANGDGGDGGGDGGGGDSGGGSDGDEGGDGNEGDGGGESDGRGEDESAAGARAPDETFLVVENDEGRHGMYLTYHDDEPDEGGEEWRTHDVLARAAGDTDGTSGWFEYTADDGGTFDDAVARFGADARLVRVGVGHGDGVTPTALGAAYGGLVVNDRRYRFPVEVARRSAVAPLGRSDGEQK